MKKDAGIRPRPFFYLLSQKEGIYDFAGDSPKHPPGCGHPFRKLERIPQRFVFGRISGSPYPERQKSYLEAEMEQGAQIYMPVDQKPVGIVSVQGCLIANLYVLPSEQNKGYGTRLLAFAVTKCQGPPSLWVLSSNQRAQKFYERNGFCPTGAVVQHTDTLWELNSAWFKPQWNENETGNQGNCLRRRIL